MSVFPDDAHFAVVDLDEARRLVLDERVPGGVHQVRHLGRGRSRQQMAHRPRGQRPPHGLTSGEDTLTSRHRLLRRSLECEQKQ